MDPDQDRSYFGPNLSPKCILAEILRKSEYNSLILLLLFPLELLY